MENRCGLLFLNEATEKLPVGGNQLANMKTESVAAL